MESFPREVPGAESQLPPTFAAFPPSIVTSAVSEAEKYRERDPNERERSAVESECSSRPMLPNEHDGYRQQAYEDQVRQHARNYGSLHDEKQAEKIRLVAYDHDVRPDETDWSECATRGRVITRGVTQFRFCSSLNQGKTRLRYRDGSRPLSADELGFEKVGFR